MTHRSRISVLLIFLGGVWGLAGGLSAEAPKRPHVVFVTGDDEYRSEITMPMIARILEAKHTMGCTVLSARPKPQTKNNLPGLEALKTADLAVFFLRWRVLPDDQMRHILDYVHSGKPIVGLRTTTHAFLYPAGHKHARWNDDFGREIVGQKWLFHHGHESSTDVRINPDRADNAILRGIEREFHLRSWLYHVVPLHGDCTPLLTGHAVNPNRMDHVPSPVAWTKTYRGARVFFTTLGHPEDFTVESFRRLMVNGIYWALGQEIPKGGTKVEVEGEYVPPPTT